MTVSFIVPGKPRGKERPRFNSKTRQTFTPQKTKDYEELVRWCYRAKCKGIKLEGEITASITAYYPIVSSASKVSKDAMIKGKIRPVVKPDADNIIKSILDALNGLAYKDDAAIVAVSAEKYYSAEPRVEITLTDGKEDVHG